MKPRTLLILTILVLGLGAFIAFYERDLPSSEERQEAAKRVLGTLTAEQVEAVTLEWDDRRVRLVHEAPPAAPEESKPAVGEGAESGTEGEAKNGTNAESDEAAAVWRLAEPFGARADKAEVEALVRKLVELEKKRTLEETGDGTSLADLGLEPPEATISLKAEGGDRVLRLGDEVPMSKDRVATLGGRPEIYVVDGSVLGEVTRDPGAWRDRRVVNLESDEVTRLELSTAGREPVVIRRDGEQFRLAAPISDLADRGEVRKLVSELAGLRAQSFLDGAEADPTQLGLEPPRAVVDIGTGQGEPLHLEVGEAKDANLGRYYGRLGGQTFVFQIADLMKTLERPAAAWRSPTWSGVEVFRVDSVRVKDAQGELTLEQQDNDWLRDGEKIPYAAASDLLYAFAGVEAERLMTPEQAAGEGLELGEPEVTLEVTAEGYPEETLTVYPAAEGGVPARASDREVVFLLTPEQRKSLETAISGVRVAKVEAEEGGGGEGEGEETEDGGEADS